MSIKALVVLEKIVFDGWEWVKDYCTLPWPTEGITKHFFE